MLLKYCRPVGYPGDLQVHPRVDPYPYFATRYGYVLNPQLSKPAGNNPGIDWVNPRQTLMSCSDIQSFSNLAGFTDDWTITHANNWEEAGLTLIDFPIS